jgi:surfeit locus 1 family protein
LGVSGPVVPLTVYLTASSSPDGPTVRPSAPPPAFSNNHLGYAATWYGLALALAGMWFAFVMRRRRG